MPFAPAQYIRPLAIALVRKGDAILVNKGFDHHKQQYFYRPLGGGIEFGESHAQAVAREFREELGVELCNIRLLAWIENIFHYEGKPGHEIIAICDAELQNKDMYERAFLEGSEGEQSFIAEWKSLWQFNETEPLYPDKLLELLRSDF